MANGGTFTGWRMVAIAFLAQNFAVVVASAAYGTALTTFQEELGTSRATASLGIAVMYLALGALSPIVGNLLQHVTLRAAMSFGAVISVLGYLVVAATDNFTIVLLAYGLLLGPAACLLGPVAAATLVSRWFEKDRGKALGIANMAVFMLLTPPIAAYLLIQGGREMLFLVLAGLSTLLFFLTRAVIERPAQIGQTIRGEESDAIVVASVGTESLSNRAFLRDTRFWLLNLAIGMLTGFGAAYATHAVPIATSLGFSLATASTVMSMYGVGLMSGALIFGWLIDRIGAMRSLVLSGTILTGLWMWLALSTNFATVLLISGLMGLAMGGGVAMHAAAINELFGTASISRGMGLSYFLKIPFLFGCAPLLGHLYDTHGGYKFALLVSAAAVALSMVIFLFLAVSARRVRPDQIR